MQFNRHFMNRIEKKDVLRLLLALVAVFVIGVLGEFVCNFPALRANGWTRQATRTIALDEVQVSGFERVETEKNGLGEITGEPGQTIGENRRQVENTEVLQLSDASGYLHIPLDGSYVSQFLYHYDYDGLLNATVRLGYRNIYGEQREHDAKMVMDRNCRVLKFSSVPVNGKLDYVDLLITREDLDEEGISYMNFGGMPLALTGFATVARAGINWYRLGLFWCAAAVLIALLCFRDFVAKRIEVGFLLISLTFGTIFSLSLPANKVSWDEEVHFAQAFWMANYRTPVQAEPALLQEFTTGVDTWPYNQPESRDEQVALTSYLNQNAGYRHGEHLWSTDLNKTTMTGYVGPALVLKAGGLLHIPFGILYKLGRLGNLYVYAAVLYFAIKKTPVGKAILAFLALMPEPMMLAGAYSYDPTVTAFLWLSFAGILEAALGGRKMDWKAYALIVLTFVWGCRVKAVYAPLILLGLMIPAEKFRSKREMYLMKGGFIVICGLMMLSFILPVLIAPRDIGDTRGDSTSEKGQMAYILGQPLAYAWVLMCNLFRTLPSYVLGENSLGLLGHTGTMSFPWALYAGSAAVILTAGQSSCGKRLSKKQKLWIFILCVGTAVLVWTSMYIAFTRPGNTYIDGVQGRYYLPFLPLVWLVLNPERVMVRMENKNYHALVLGAAALILAATVYLDIWMKFCR